MTGQRSLARALPGLVFALIVCASLTMTVFDTISRQNQAKAEAAERVRQQEAARLANRERVERTITGTWVGRFGAQTDARLTIKRTGDQIDAILLNERFRETFRGEFLPDDRLQLVPLEVTVVRGSRNHNYAPDTLWLELGHDDILRGTYRDTRNNTGVVEMRRVARRKR